MKKGLVLLFILAACTAFAGENLLVLSSGSGKPGSTDNLITLSVDNEDTLKGLSLTVTDLTPFITVDSVWIAAGTNPQIFSYNYSDEAIEIILLVSKNRLILPNKGSLMNISYSVAAEAPQGQVYALGFNEVTVMDKNNQKLPFTVQDGSFLIIEETNSGINDNGITVDTYELTQNYPNPFNPETRIQYRVPFTQQVRLDIFNTAGQLVKNLVNYTVGAGTHTVVWSGMNEVGMSVPAGVYFYRIQAGEFELTKQLALIR
ncbi:MAG TPA: FlgD immunoglobulin-like domain containing protein [bacterium]|nr:FlgD immunoglobulin-like domain containing protein [bacterium]HPN42646.1 FlgD immunoglobulin-like domain containing protein [bacterium]